jgi:hypothetical protein
MTVFTPQSAFGAGPPTARAAAAVCTAYPGPNLVEQPGRLCLRGYVVVAAGMAGGAPTSWGAGKGKRTWSG